MGTEEVQDYNAFIRRLSEIIIKVHSAVGHEVFTGQWSELSSDETKDHGTKEC